MIVTLQSNHPIMRPSRTTIVIGVAWLLFWVLMIAVAVQDFLRDGGTQLWQPVLWESSSAVTISLLMWMQRRATRHYDAWLGTPSRWFGRQALWLPLFWIAFVPIAFGIRHGVYALLGATYPHPPWPQVFLYEAVKLTLFLSLFTVIRFGILSYRALSEETLRAEQARTLLQQAQVQQLTQQMQPHFLFNALNTISSLMHTDVERADSALAELADVLRITLDGSNRQEAPLADELHLVRGYTRIMAERFAERVEIAWEIDADALPCRIPVMSLQPLVENIFKHTVSRCREQTRIVIAARREQQTLVVSTTDDRGTLAGGKPGISLKNLQTRLEALYGGAASLTLAQLAPAGVRAEFRLPCAS